MYDADRYEEFLVRLAELSTEYGFDIAGFDDESPGGYLHVYETSTATIVSRSLSYDNGTYHTG